MCEFAKHAPKNILITDISSHSAKGQAFLMRVILLIIISLFYLGQSTNSSFASEKYEEEMTKIAGITNLMSAVAVSDSDGVRFFIKSDPISVNEKNIGGATALHIAARVGDLQIATLLVEARAEVNASDNEGFTPLMRAAIMGYSDIVELLLRYGAKVLAINSFGETAILHSSMSGCGECLGMLFAKIDESNEKFSNSNLLLDQLFDGKKVSIAKDDEQIEKMIDEYASGLSRVSSYKNKYALKSEKIGKSEYFNGDEKLVKIVEATPKKRKRLTLYVLVEGKKYEGEEVPSNYLAVPKPRMTLRSSSNQTRYAPKAPILKSKRYVLGKDKN